jgi:hypothetical protein
LSVRHHYPPTLIISIISLTTGQFIGCYNWAKSGLSLKDAWQEAYGTYQIDPANPAFNAGSQNFHTFRAMVA